MANFTIGIRLASPEFFINAQGQPQSRTIRNVPFDPKVAAQSDAVSLRVLYAPAEKAKVQAMLLSAKTKLGYEGEPKSGEFTDGTLWTTVGRRAATDNTSAMEAFLSA